MAWNQRPPSYNQGYPVSTGYFYFEFRQEHAERMWQILWILLLYCLQHLHVKFVYLYVIKITL